MACLRLKAYVTNNLAEVSSSILQCIMWILFFTHPALCGIRSVQFGIHPVSPVIIAIPYENIPDMRGKIHIPCKYNIKIQGNIYLSCKILYIPYGIYNNMYRIDYITHAILYLSYRLIFIPYRTINIIYAIMYILYEIMSFMHE